MPKKTNDVLVVYDRSRRFFINKPPLKVYYTIARRLKIAGTAISILDSVSSFLYNRFDDLKDFQARVIPAWASAIYYIVPSLVVWAFMIRDWFRQKPNDLTPDTLSAKALLTAMKQLPHTNKALESHSAEREKFYELIHSFQYLGSNLKLDIILTNCLLLVRELHGCLFLLETLQIATQDKSQTITQLAGDIYFGLNTIYTIAMMIQKVVREEKSTMHADQFFSSTVMVLKAINKFKSLSTRAKFKREHPSLADTAQTLLTNKEPQLAQVVSKLPLQIHIDEMKEPLLPQGPGFK